MWPPTKPKRASKSGGAKTWRCSIAFGRFGAKRARIATILSAASFALRARSSRRRRSYGKYCAKIERMCFPGGASDGSVGVCRKHSISGSSLSPPLQRVVVRLLQIVDRRRDVNRRAVVRLRVRSRAARKIRQLAQREIHLQRRPDRSSIAAPSRRTSARAVDGRAGRGTSCAGARSTRPGRAAPLRCHRLSEFHAARAIVVDEHDPRNGRVGEDLGTVRDARPMRARCETDPIPPRTNAHAPCAPSRRPARWCAST